MRISQFIEKLRSFESVFGDVEVIIKPFYDELPYEPAAVDSVRVVEGKSESGDPLWIESHDDDREVVRVRVF